MLNTILGLWHRQRHRELGLGLKLGLAAQYHNGPEPRGYGLGLELGLEGR